MNWRSIAKTISLSLVGACSSAYILAVTVRSGVTRDDDFWPYPWLWIVAIVAVMAAGTWLGLVLPFTRKAERSPETVLQSMPRMFRGNLSPIDLLSKSVGEILVTPGHQLTDVTATIRASDLRYVVRYGTGEPIGVVEPTRGLYRGSHIRTGDVGTFESMPEVLRAIWEADG
jgi:hypothetical protein